MNSDTGMDFDLDLDSNSNLYLDLYLDLDMLHFLLSWCTNMLSLSDLLSYAL